MERAGMRREVSGQRTSCSRRLYSSADPVSLCSPGIPHRRGYLFYGVPGSGKTSLIHALAGTLRLNIYVVNLAQNG